jgi:DNA-binding transcriptional ArsR family regulator
MVSTEPSAEHDGVTLLRRPEDVSVLLPKPRVRLLEELQRPDSAAGLSRRLGIPRQKLNYHLRELEEAGLVELVEERRRGNCVERVLRASARRYVISPEVLGTLGEDPEEIRDHFSSSYLVAVAARAIRDLAELRQLADEAGQKLPTMTIESELRFSSAADRNAFAKELSDAVAHLIVKYHDSESPEGRAFHLLLAAYPSIPAPDGDDHKDGVP